MRTANISNCGYNISRYKKAADGLVDSNMVGNNAKEWSKRTWITERIGDKKSSNSMDMASQNRSKLSGTVEIDEAYIGGESVGKRGRGAENKVVIAVACELDGEKLGRCRMSMISDASAISLHTFITENIEKGSQLITDDWSGFSGIEGKGFSRVIHVQKSTKDEDKMLPHVHTIVSLLKRWLLGTHQGKVSPNHLQAYLDEYVFRFNRRKSAQRGLLFYRLLASAMHTKAITYDGLTKHNI